MVPLKDTLGSDDWMKANLTKIKEVFPDTWTMVHELDLEQIGDKIRAIGIEWHGQEELGLCFQYFMRVGIIMQNRTNPMFVKRGMRVA